MGSEFASPKQKMSLSVWSASGLPALSESLIAIAREKREQTPHPYATAFLEFVSFVVIPPASLRTAHLSIPDAAISSLKTEP
jgi:hypothetical protein